MTDQAFAVQRAQVFAEEERVAGGLAPNELGQGQRLARRAVQSVGDELAEHAGRKAADVHLPYLAAVGVDVVEGHR